MSALGAPPDADVGSPLGVVPLRSALSASPVYHLWRVPWRSWCMSALGAPPDADVGSPLGVVPISLCPERKPCLPSLAGPLEVLVHVRPAPAF